MHFWIKTQPDIITGWNIQFFDIPYLCNRISKLLGEEEILYALSILYPQAGHVVLFI